MGSENTDIRCPAESWRSGEVPARLLRKQHAAAVLRKQHAAADSKSRWVFPVANRRSLPPLHLSVCPCPPSLPLSLSFSRSLSLFLPPMAQ